MNHSTTLTASGTHTLYTEIQRPRQWWIAAIMLVVTLVGWGGFVQQIVLDEQFGNRPAPDWVVVLIWLVFGIGFPVTWWLAFMRTTVYPDHIEIRWFPFYTRRVPLVEIETVAVRRYHPVREYGGWGIRAKLGRDDRALTVSGDTGVQLTLTGGRRLLIGSQHSDELVAAINTVWRGHSAR